ITVTLAIASAHPRFGAIGADCAPDLLGEFECVAATTRSPASVRRLIEVLIPLVPERVPSPVAPRLDHRGKVDDPGILKDFPQLLLVVRQRGAVHWPIDMGLLVPPRVDTSDPARQHGVDRLLVG